MNPRGGALGSAEAEDETKPTSAKFESEFTELIDRLKPIFEELVPDKFYDLSHSPDNSLIQQSRRMYQYLGLAYAQLKQLDTAYKTKHESWFAIRMKYLSSVRHFRQVGRVCLATCRINLPPDKWDSLANLTVEQRVHEDYETACAAFEALGPSSGSGEMKARLRKFLQDCEALKVDYPDRVGSLAQLSLDIQPLLKD